MGIGINTEHQPQCWSCNHANECPVNCTCGPDCYCKREGGCKLEFHAFEHKVFVVYGDSGREEGIGRILAAFTNCSTANIYAAGKGWYGGRGHVREQLAITLPNGNTYLVERELQQPIDLDRLQHAADEQLKSNAMSKLTQEEQRILGLI